MLWARAIERTYTDFGPCLMLAPNGKKLELFEVDLWTGEFVPVKTDLYVPDTIPLAFTRVARPLVRAFYHLEYVTYSGANPG
jgi:hypothetical protein